MTVESGGAVSLSSQKVREGDDPPPPPLSPREGLSCLEVHDADDRVLDRRALPLEPVVYHDAEDAPGQLSGGAVPVPRLSYHIRLPRRPGRNQTLHVFRVRRRASAPSAAKSLSAAPGSDLEMDPQAVVPLGDVP